MAFGEQGASTAPAEGRGNVDGELTCGGDLSEGRPG
jgi:hypothetical protein